MMVSNIEEYCFFTQEIKFRKKFCNKEIKLLQFFHSKTNLFPQNILVHKNYLFFFINNADYFEAKKFLRSLREVLNFKVLIIREEKRLINLIFSFFPDIYIHDLKLHIDEQEDLKTITVFFLSYKERGIAIGRKGEYIKAVNNVFKEFSSSYKDTGAIKLNCKITSL